MIEQNQSSTMVVLLIATISLLVPTIQSIEKSGAYKKSEDCSSNGFLGKSSVQQCSADQIKINGRCKEKKLCPKRHFLKDGFCQICQSSCRSCISHGICSSCPMSRVLHGGKCMAKCPRNRKPVRSYYDDFEPIRICVPRRKDDVKCSVGEWSDWSDCGDGALGGPHTKTRTRLVGGETACAGMQPIEYRLCYNLVPNNEVSACIVSEWFPWEQCDPSCKNKFRKRRRIVEDLPGGLRRRRTLCPNLVEEEPCPCPLETHLNDMMRCNLEEWSEWSDCNTPCGSGSQTRTRNPVTSPQDTRRNPCKPMKETRRCCETTCQDYCSSTLLGSWSDWGKCEGSCDMSVRRRVRRNIFKDVLMFCDIAQLFEEQPCKRRNCSKEKEICVLSEWSEWSECYQGSRSRVREQYSGSNCAELADSQPCPS